MKDHCHVQSISNMLKFILVGVFVLYNVLFVRGTGDDPMIGPGKWKIYHISFKEGQINDIVIDLHQSMLNRTHYVYSGDIITHEPLDEGLGLKMDVCKYMDGGCKQFLVMTDDSFVAFANKFAEKNIEICFSSMGIEPAKLPLAKGSYKVKGFLFDTLLLPAKSHYGRFIADLCAMKGNTPVGCITCECEFEPNESSSEEDDI